MAHAVVLSMDEVERIFLVLDDLEPDWMQCSPALHPESAVLIAWPVRRKGRTQ